jgi:glycosyl hydrolase family 100 (putative invertase)
MIVHFQRLYEDALDLLHRLTTPDGILASTIESDNYKRIWARDSIICGLAGLMIADTILMEGLKNSLLSLARNQHDLGMIPSNLLPNSDGDISFGSLVGRVDANTWFIIGSCQYYRLTKDEATWSLLKPAVEKCRKYLRSVEYNDKGWIYTPLSGNWADEYPVHGFTLYDNMLRLWGESLWRDITGEETNNFEDLKHQTLSNFWPSEGVSEENIYHKGSFGRLDLDTIDHFIAFILPGKYDTRFDAAGNALALLQFDLDDVQKKSISRHISTITSEISKPLIPAFWSVITEESEDWNLLKDNYSYSFKNKPGAFHNGGIWPVWMGLFCLGLANNGLQKEAEVIIAGFIDTISENPNWDFQEYINALTLEVGGKTQMGYTASGIVFMQLALQNKLSSFF